MSEIAERDIPAEQSAGRADDESAFVLLCAGELRERYSAAVAIAGRQTHMVHTIEALLAECVQRPPLGILLDMNAMTRLGAMATAPLFELDVDWPILRCTLLPDGGANFMSVDPMRFGPLDEALREIAGGDPTWRREGRLRGSLRIKVACRLAVRRDDRSPWIAANCINVSVGGLFAVTYETFAPGEPIEIELRDLAATPICLRGRIVRVRTWEASTELPGIAVQFEPETVSADYKRLLARPDMIHSLLRGCRKRELPVEALLDDTDDIGDAMSMAGNCLELGAEEAMELALQTPFNSPQ
jgi:hypothetical protein